MMITTTMATLKTITSTWHPWCRENTRFHLHLRYHGSLCQQQQQVSRQNRVWPRTYCLQDPCCRLLPADGQDGVQLAPSVLCSRCCKKFGRALSCYNHRACPQYNFPRA
jgi:hypothetical protein